MTNTSAGASTSDVAGDGAGADAAPSPVVTQVDREAAALFKPYWGETVRGLRDQLPIVQAFARHREAEQERCARVADAKYNQIHPKRAFEMESGHYGVASNLDASMRTASIIASQIRGDQ